MVDADATQIEIQRLLERLDNEAKRYEARWGADNLPHLVPQDIAGKWQAQRRKLDAAIKAGNVTALSELVDGTIRGYAALEKAAIAAGHNCNPPDVWEAIHPDSGRKYRIAVNTDDARKAAAEGVASYSLDEVVRILESQQLVNVVKDSFPGAKVTGIKKQPMDWKNGDSVPF